MKERIDWRPCDTLPERQGILRLQGIPPSIEPPPRTVELLESAIAIYLESAEPRALAADISREAFAAVYRGEGRNAAETPIEQVAMQADALALFVATAGGRVSERIRTLFSRNEPALAVMVDSVASAAADRLTELLAGRRVETLASAAGQGQVTLGYSPGYCGWHVSGQRALFAFLGPGSIGVTLNDSCLMNPLKSVSGVLATGPAGIHGFTPAYDFCAECRTKRCLGRIRMSPAPAPAG